MTEKSHTDFATLMGTIFRIQAKQWREKRRNSAAPRAYDLLEQVGNWQCINERTLKSIYSNDNDPVIFSDDKLVMFLPPLEKDTEFVPVMSVEYHPHPVFENSYLRLRILMIRGGDDGFEGMGFRFESPESNNPATNNGRENGDGESIHDFYHAQLIKGVGYGPSISVPDWLPCHQPSFPLWAVNPVDAVLNLILTLYGLKYYRKFLTEMSTIRFSEEFRKLNERLSREQTT